MAEKKKKKEEPGKPVGFYEAPSGSQFVLPEREIKELEARGKIAETEEPLTYKKPEQMKREGISQQRLQEEQERQRQEEILPIAEETGVFEDRPERVELNPTEEELKQKPPTYKRFLFGSPIKEASKIIFGKDEGEKIDDLIQNPETLRSTMLQEIQREELDKSLTSSQKLGGILEPYLGDLKVFDVDIGGYVNQWVQMPQKDVNTIVEQIAELESSVSGMTDSASQGEIGNPAEVLRDIAEKERTLAIYEVRIKKLILESDELKANPEKVNLIEEKILSARETFFEAKQRAAEGALVTPTDSQLYLKLKRLRENA
jgi:hypothetical protein